jgi:hypothetical protein
MTSRKLGTIAVVLAVLSIGNFGLFLYFIVQSGCAGDLKSGLHGDAMEALRLEGIAFSFFTAGLLAGSVAAALIPYQTRTARFISAIAFFWVVGIALWFLALFVQGEATQRCFAA